MADFHPESPGTEVTSVYKIGDTVIVDGIECVVVYDAGSEQSWGRYLLVDKNHDLSYYISGNDYCEKQLPINDAKYGYEWGGRGINTGTGSASQEIGNGLKNTNTILALNLQPETSGWPVLWDKVKEFRESHSNKWFVPTRTEMIQVIGRKYEELENFTVNTSATYFTSSEYSNNSAWAQFTSDGGQSTYSKSYHECRVRLCCYMSDPNAPKAKVNITCSTQGASIHYTTDGSDPSESSPEYTESLSVPPGTLIKAVGVKAGLLNSDIVQYQTDYSVTLSVGTGGTASADKTLVAPGQRVTVTVSPSGNYDVGAIVVRDSAGADVSYTSTSTGFYFVMPSSNVTIEIEFAEEAPCLDADALVTLADGTYKKFRDLSENDRIMVLNLDEGHYDAAPILWKYKIGTADWYWLLRTDSGREMKVIKNHRFLSPDLERFERATNLVGHKVMTGDGEETVVSCTLVHEKTDFCNAISYYHMNVIVGGFITSCGFNNIYPIRDMKFDTDTKRHRGTSLEYWNAKGIPQKWYEGMRIEEQYSPDEEIVKYVKDRS